jgi:hypothetical protein
MEESLNLYLGEALGGQLLLPKIYYLICPLQP